jgi:hypothetical protein
LNAAVQIADTMAARVTPGDADNSPWPFRVNAATGKIAEQNINGKRYIASYTSNWTPTLRLFSDLDELKEGQFQKYRIAATLVAAWLKKYPIRTNKWGPFFEDVGEYSDTEINADTMALYILEHPTWDTNGHAQARGILQWSEDRLGNHNFEKLLVVPQNEQTVYLVPGNSHTSRHGSVELLYVEKTGDSNLKPEAIRRLNWATYSVAVDGENRYPSDAVWLTDGYGDYVRHYLRAMASTPELAPKDQNHLLRTSSVIQRIQYGPEQITYRKFDTHSVEEFKLGASTPKAIRGGRMSWDRAKEMMTIQASSRDVTVSLAPRSGTN